MKHKSVDVEILLRSSMRRFSARAMVNCSRSMLDTEITGILNTGLERATLKLSCGGGSPRKVMS